MKRCSIDKYTTDDNEMIEKVQEYIRDKTYNYAIMIDGEWGCGKTYFIEKILKKKWEEEGQKSIYLSLYGYSKIEEIINDIYIKNYLNLFGEKTSKLPTAITSIFIDKIFSNAGKRKAKIQKIFTEILPINSEKVIIFDDLERCLCPVHEILGFINELVEHRNIKVIIVANQDEIYKEEREKYRNTREKVIGQIFYYRPDIKSIFTRLIEDKITEKTLKEIMLKKTDDYVQSFMKGNHMNIRTILFFLSKVSIFYTYDKEFDNKHLDILVSLCLDCCLEYKSKQIASDNKMDKKPEENTKGNLYLSSYLLLTTFIEKSIWDSTLYQEAKSEFIRVQQKNDTTEIINALASWFIKEDTEIIEIIEKLLNNLNHFEIKDYPKIIYYLTVLNSYDLLNEKMYFPILERIADILYDNSNDEYFFMHAPTYAAMFEDKKRQEDYLGFINTIQKYINTKKPQLNIIDLWLKESDKDESLKLLEKMKKEYLNKELPLFSQASTEKIVAKFNHMTSVEIFYLRDFIRNYHFISVDKEYLDELKKQLSAYKGDKIKKIQIDLFCRDIDTFLSNLI